MQVLVRHRPQLAAGKAGAAERRQAVTIGPIDGAQHIGTVARAADGNEQVARTSQVLELFDKDTIEALVVAPGKNVRRVIGQAQHAQAFLLIVLEVLTAKRSLAEV